MQENMTIEEKEELEAERFALAYERIRPRRDAAGRIMIILSKWRISSG